MATVGLSMSFVSMFGVMLLAGGLSGLPLGIPPTEPDPRMERVAPEECLFYLSWSGMAEASSDSPNHTERLLAEPEIRRFIDEVISRLTAALKQGAGQGVNSRRVAEITPRILKVIAANPTAVFAGKFREGASGMTVPVGIVVNVGEGVATFEDDLLAILEILTDQPVPEAVDGVRTLVTPLGIPKIQWAVRDGYFILGVSEGTIAQIEQRMAGVAVAEWLTAIKDRLPVDRVSSVTFINTKEILAAATPLLMPFLMARGPESGNPLDALGLSNLDSVINVTGLNETGTVSRTRLKTSGKPTGLLAMLDAEPLQASDLAAIPADSTIAFSTKLDPVKTMDRFFTLIDLIEPGASKEIRRELQGLDSEIGFSLENDLIGSLGESWSVYQSPSEGGRLFTNWTAVVDIRNAAALRVVSNTIVDRVNKFEEMRTAQGGRMRMVGLRKLKVGRQTVHFMNAIGEDLPVAPAWCVTDEHLIISLFPQGVAAFLNRKPSIKTLASLPHVQHAIQKDRPPIGLVHIDSVTVCRTVYPLVLLGANMLFSELQREGVDINISVMPDGETIARHLQPAIMTVTSLDDGIEIFSTRTLPVSLGAGTSILPSLFLVRTSRSHTRFGQPTGPGLLDILSPRRAQMSTSTTNLKQLGIAMHNFHDVNSRFPVAAVKDEDGKPLLSWRVQLLPFLDEQALFKEFRQDEAWDSPHNKALIDRMPRALITPGSKAGKGKTNYVGLHHENAIFRDGDGTRFRDITDGTSNTVMIAEVDDDHAVIWTKPEDLKFDQKNPHTGLGELRKGSFLVVLCDGAVQVLPATVTAETLVKLVFRNDAQAIDFSEFRAGVLRQRAAEASVIRDRSPVVEESR